MILWKYTVSKQTNKRLNKLTKRTTKSTKIKVVKQNDKKKKSDKKYITTYPENIVKNGKEKRA